MEAIVVAALVAGAVSLLGVAANVYIARRSARTAVGLAIMQKRLEDNYRVLLQVRELEAETERLRVAGWYVIASLARLREAGVSAEGVQALVEQSVDLFSTRAQTFLDSWASVKPDIPPDLVEYPASLRHECRARLDNTILALVVFKGAGGNDRMRRREVEENIVRARREVTELLDALELFGRTLGTIRRVVDGKNELRRLTAAAPDGRAEM